MMIVIAIPCRICGAAFVALAIGEWESRDIPRALAICESCR